MLGQAERNTSRPPAYGSISFPRARRWHCYCDYCCSTAVSEQQRWVLPACMCYLLGQPRCRQKDTRTSSRRFLLNSRAWQCRTNHSNPLLCVSSMYGTYCMVIWQVLLPLLLLLLISASRPIVHPVGSGMHALPSTAGKRKCCQASTTYSDAVFFVLIEWLCGSEEMVVLYHRSALFFLRDVYPTLFPSDFCPKTWGQS